MDPITIAFGVIGVAEKLIPLVAQLVHHAKQSGELTPEQEAELDKRVADLQAQPWWKPQS